MRSDQIRFLCQRSVCDYTITEHGWYGKTAKDAMTTVRKKEPRNLAIANRSRSASYNTTSG